MWLRLAPLLKEFKIHYSNRLRVFMEAVFWKLRTGAPWRDLPTEFGSYSSVFNKTVTLPCSSCSPKPLIAMIDKLDKVYNAY
jgi:transposase